MSFGFSPSDIVALVSITTKAYRGWKNACGEYSEVTGSLDSFLIVLERVEDEALKPNSVLLRTVNDRQDLKDILSNSEPTVRELHAMVIRFKSLGSSREKNWDKLRLGVKNLDPLRVRLTQHIAAITAYLDAVGLGALGRIERDLNTIPDRIQRTIDGLAAEIRAGRREGSIMTTYSDDDKDVWKQFRRELIGDGMKSKSVHKYKPLIRKYLKQLGERGELEELTPECETQLGKSLENLEVAKLHETVESVSDMLDQAAMPNKQAQQVTFARGYIARAKMAEQGEGLGAKERDAQSPRRSSNISTYGCELSPRDLSATNASTSISSIHAERELDKPSRAGQGVTTPIRGHSLHATVEDVDEGTTMIENKATKRHEADCRESEKSYTSGAVKLSPSELTEGNQEIEPNPHSPSDKEDSNTKANSFHIKAEAGSSDEHRTGAPGVDRSMHATVEDAEDSDAPVCDRPTKSHATEGVNSDETPIPKSEGLNRSEVTSKEAKLTQSDGAEAGQGQDALLSHPPLLRTKFQFGSDRKWTGRAQEPAEYLGRPKQRGFNQYSRDVVDDKPVSKHLSFHRKKTEPEERRTETEMDPSSKDLHPDSNQDFSWPAGVPDRSMRATGVVLDTPDSSENSRSSSLSGHASDGSIEPYLYSTRDRGKPSSGTGQSSIPHFGDDNKTPRTRRKPSIHLSFGTCRECSGWGFLRTSEHVSRFTPCLECYGFGNVAYCRECGSSMVVRERITATSRVLLEHQTQCVFCDGHETLDSWMLLGRIRDPSRL